MTTLGKSLRAFGHFWLDFLIGDTPEIFLGTLVIVAVALLLGHEQAIGITLALLLTALLLVASTYRAASGDPWPRVRERRSASRTGGCLAGRACSRQRGGGVWPGLLAKLAGFCRQAVRPNAT